MWVKKNETQFSDECKDRNLAWHQMSLPWWILFFFFFLIFTSKCRRVIRAKFISFLINFFATYCNILSVNNEMKMLQILQCVVSRRGEGESERLWQLVCAPSFALAVYDFLISLQVPRRVANNIFLGCCANFFLPRKLDLFTWRWFNCVSHKKLYKFNNRTTKLKMISSFLSVICLFYVNLCL